jgi:hypothetical protein
MGHYPLIIIIPENIATHGENQAYHYVDGIMHRHAYHKWTIGGQWNQVLKSPHTLEEYIDLDLEFVSIIHYNMITVDEFIHLNKLLDAVIIDGDHIKDDRSFLHTLSALDSVVVVDVDANNHTNCS